MNADIGDVDITFIDEQDPHVNSLGVHRRNRHYRVAAAIANAVYHATGRRMRNLAITLDKLI